MSICTHGDLLTQLLIDLQPFTSQRSISREVNGEATAATTTVGPDLTGEEILCPCVRCQYLLVQQYAADGDLLAQHEMSLEIRSHHHKYAIVQSMNVAFGSSRCWHKVIKRGSKRVWAVNDGRGPCAAFCVLQMRFQTKFMQEQKEKMLEFANKVGWRI